MFVFGGRERLLYLLALYTQKVSCQSCVSHILYLKNPALFMLERPIFVSRRHYKNGSALCGADLRYTFYFLDFLTDLLNCSPLSNSFLKTPKLAAPGESKTISPFLALATANFIAAFILSKTSIGNFTLPSDEIILLETKPLNKARALTDFFTILAYSPYSRFLSAPPPIKIILPFFSSRDSRAAIPASGVVAVVSL